MSSEIIQHSSISGELAENLWGRTDFEKYDGGWAQARNWVVDYRGGLFTRAGFEFGDVVEWSSGENAKAIEFQYSPDDANTYLCLFTNNKVRFIQDNAYVLESDFVIEALENDTGDRVEFRFTPADFTSSAKQASAAVTYTFDTTVEGWTFTESTNAVSAGILTHESTGTNPALRSPTGLGINGTTYNKVRARIQRTNGNSWDGKVFWSTGGGLAYGRTATISAAPVGIDGDFVVVEWDMTVTSGTGDLWVGETIDQFEIQLFTNSGHIMDIDWIQVGSDAEWDFVDGDWIKLSGFTTNAELNTQTVEMENVTASTFNAKTVIDDASLEIASVTTEAAMFNRIYTVTTTYTSAELPRLKGRQVRDTLELTHPDHALATLTRNDTTDWVLADVVIFADINTPTNISDTPSGDENEAFTWQVTAINENDEESSPIIYLSIDGPDMVFQDNRYILISWTAVSDAVKYFVYRSRNFSANANVISDAEVGFVGESIGTEFTDNGITPDFTRKPPRQYNPFADGAIRYVNVTTPGSGYAYDDTITWPAGGSGAEGYIVADTLNDPVKGIIVLNGGSGYTDTAVSALGGSAFVGVAELTPISGNNPHCSATFQSRSVYGATNNNPLRIFGSRVGQFNNFNFTALNLDDDSYEFDIESPKVVPVRHLVPVRAGLLAFTEIGVWLVTGSESRKVTPNDAQAEPQNNVGASDVPPVYVDAFVVYIANAGQEIRLLSYDDFSKLYGGQNISMLSNHLFDSEKEIQSLTYAPIPSKSLYAVNNQGMLISLTIDLQNNVFAATPQQTKGRFHYAVATLEERESRVYSLVERNINGNEVMFFERLRRREHFDILENSFCVDAGLELARTEPAAKLTSSSSTGAVTFTTDASVFTSGNIGDVIRCGTGKATISGYTSGTEVDGTWDRDLEETEPEDTIPRVFASGEWTMDTPATTISGLWQLEGEDVTVLADGTEITGKTVSGGQITLSTAASRVMVGLGYSCIAKTLPPTVSDLPIEGRLKDTVNVSFRMYQSIGLKTGCNLDSLHEIADQEQTLFSLPDRLRSEMLYEPLLTDFDRDNQIYFVQDTPRPAAILNVIRDMDLGDDKQ